MLLSSSRSRWLPWAPLWKRSQVRNLTRGLFAGQMQEVQLGHKTAANCKETQIPAENSGTNRCSLAGSLLRGGEENPSQEKEELGAFQAQAAQTHTPCIACYDTLPHLRFRKGSCGHAPTPVGTQTASRLTPGGQWLPFTAWPSPTWGWKKGLCRDCHPATPAMLRWMPVCHRQGGGRRGGEAGMRGTEWEPLAIPRSGKEMRDHPACPARDSYQNNSFGGNWTV